MPSWAEDESIGARTFNARAETVATTPSYRASFKRRRALVVADAFDAWLDPGIQDREALEGLLHASPRGTLARHRVGRAVGRVGVDGPELVEAV